MHTALHFSVDFLQYIMIHEFMGELQNQQEPISAQALLSSMICLQLKELQTSSGSQEDPFAFARSDGKMDSREHAFDNAICRCRQIPA